MRSYILFVLLFAFSCSFYTCKKNAPAGLRYGMLIQQSVSFEPDTIYLNNKASFDQPAIKVTGKNITVDFNNSVIIGSKDYYRPDSFRGLGLDINEGKNITIENLKIRGFKTGLRAKNIQGFKLINADLSYNYRPKLQSLKAQKNSLLKKNEKNIRPEGAAIYLENCDSFFINQVNIQQVVHGLVLNQCNDGLIFQNNFSFNTQSGLQLIQSSGNRIIGNQLDWNTAGFSYGQAALDLGAAGIHLQQKSSQNIIAFNSITHNEKAIRFSNHGKQEATENSANLIAGNNFSYEVHKDTITKKGQNTFIQNEYENKSDVSSDTITSLKHIIEELKVQQFPELKKQYTGYKHILMDDYGPYNFDYPFICTRDQSGEMHTLAIFGPFGNFKVTGVKGLKSTSKKRGALPVTLVLSSKADAQQIELEAEYIGSAFTDAYGVQHKKGIPVKLFWQAKAFPVE